jgi:hypothetical protein
MACSNWHAEFTPEIERRWPRRWWILPAVIPGLFVWVWIVWVWINRRVAEAFWWAK